MNDRFINLIFFNSQASSSIATKIPLMKDYLKNETISLCRNQYEIQICIPACKMNSEFFSNYLSLLFNFTQKSTNNAKNEYSQISHGIVLQKTGLTSFNPAQTCKCQKREREYKLMLKIQQGRWKQTWSCVTQMVMAKIQDRKKNTIPEKKRNSHHL